MESVVCLIMYDYAHLCFIYSFADFLKIEWDVMEFEKLKESHLYTCVLVPPRKKNWAEQNLTPGITEYVFNPYATVCISSSGEALFYCHSQTLVSFPSFKCYSCTLNAMLNPARFLWSFCSDTITHIHVHNVCFTVFVRTFHWHNDYCRYLMQ